MKMKVTPRFNVREIIDSTIRKDWFSFQSRAVILGQSLQIYMQNYINSRRKRRGTTGNLAKSVTFDVISTFPARVEWGVGNISVLNTQAPYWYVVNYGKMVGGQPFVPNRGRFVPGSFEGNAPHPAMKTGVQKFNYNDGSKMGMSPKSAIRPLNYIQASRARFNRDFRKLLLSIKKGL